MPLNRLSIAAATAAALLLAACGQQAPASEARENASDTAVEQVVEGPERRILAFGDSLFAGYGLDIDDSYPSQLEDALRDNGINARIANAGVSGDTSAAGLQRLAFTLDAQEVKPDLVILELGGNDLLRGLSPAETRANFEAMLDILKQRDIPVLLMGMRAPPNYGGEFQRQFDNLYPELAREYGATLVPFWLESIYRDQSLFQSDRIHPTAEGIAKLVDATADEVGAALPED